MSTPFDVLIPARYDSTRLPAKALRDINGTPLILHVVACARASAANRVIVATDDERIYEVVVNAGSDCVITSSEHQTGTDRLAEASALLGLSDDRIVVNLQGDEPQTPAALINQVATELADFPQASIATVGAKFQSWELFIDPAVVKLVTDSSGKALYFSRAPMPWPRDSVGTIPPQARRHVGIYAYRVRYLKYYAASTPTINELTEKLEQLRALDHGHEIRVCDAIAEPGEGVDTEEDLRRVAQAMRGSE